VFEGLGVGRVSGSGDMVVVVVEAIGDVVVVEI